jgi:hypothetical protein
MFFCDFVGSMLPPFLRGFLDGNEPVISNMTPNSLRTGHEAKAAGGEMPIHVISSTEERRGRQAQSRRETQWDLEVTT